MFGVPPDFGHAGSCQLPPPYPERPDVGRRCTCGADKMRAGWNAAVEACAAEVEASRLETYTPQMLADMLRRKSVTQAHDERKPSP